MESAAAPEPASYITRSPLEEERRALRAKECKLNRDQRKHNQRKEQLRKDEQKLVQLDVEVRKRERGLQLRLEQIRDRERRNDVLVARHKRLGRHLVDVAASLRKQQTLVASLLTSQDFNDMMHE